MRVQSIQPEVKKPRTKYSEWLIHALDEPVRPKRRAVTLLDGYTLYVFRIYTKYYKLADPSQKKNIYFKHLQRFFVQALDCIFFIQEHSWTHPNCFYTRRFNIQRHPSRTLRSHLLSIRSDCENKCLGSLCGVNIQRHTFLNISYTPPVHKIWWCI